MFYFNHLDFRALLCFLLDLFFDLFFSRCLLFLGSISFCPLGRFSFLSGRLGRCDFRKFEKIIHASLKAKVLEFREAKTNLICLSLCFLHSFDSIAYAFFIESFFRGEKFYALFDLAKFVVIFETRKELTSGDVHLGAGISL